MLVALLLAVALWVQTCTSVNVTTRWELLNCTKPMTSQILADKYTLYHCVDTKAFVIHESHLQETPVTDSEWVQLEVGTISRKKVKLHPITSCLRVGNVNTDKERTPDLDQVWGNTNQTGQANNGGGVQSFMVGDSYSINLGVSLSIPFFNYDTFYANVDLQLATNVNVERQITYSCNVGAGETMQILAYKSTYTLEGWRLRAIYHEDHTHTFGDWYDLPWVTFTRKEEEFGCTSDPAQLSC